MLITPFFAILAKGKEGVPLNLGMGAGLVLLLAKSAVELNKMVELRKQMEILLTDIKNEIDQRRLSLIALRSRKLLWSPTQTVMNMAALAIAFLTNFQKVKKMLSEIILEEVKIRWRKSLKLNWNACGSCRREKCISASSTRRNRGKLNCRKENLMLCYIPLELYWLVYMVVLYFVFF